MIMSLSGSDFFIAVAPKVRDTFDRKPTTVSESTVSNTELSELFCPHRVPRRNSVSSSRQKRTHRLFRRTHRVCPKTQRGLSSETVLSKQYSTLFVKLMGERGGGDPGICDSPMPLCTGQTNTEPPKACDTPCLAQGRPKLRSMTLCMTVRCRSADGKRDIGPSYKKRSKTVPPQHLPPPQQQSSPKSTVARVRLGFALIALVAWKPSVHPKYG